MKLRHFKKTVIGLVRKANEDSIGSLTNEQTNGYGEIFVVCDGMGGHVGGAVASKTAVDCILQYFKDSPNSNPSIALEKAISFANMQIYAKSIHDKSLKGMGTTCTVLLHKEDNIYIGHVGDSRIYIYTDDKLYRLTKDHSFVQSLVDAGQLKDSEMETHPKKNELTRALGISQNVEVDVAETPIFSKSGDKFLLCSDGLCGLVNDATIANTLETTVGDETVNDLIKLAENAGGNDNISVCVIHVIDSPHQTTKFKDQTNKSNHLMATQILDASLIKRETKVKTIFRIYGKYILTLILMGSLFLGYTFLIKESPDKMENNLDLEKDIESTNSTIENETTKISSQEEEEENKELEKKAAARKEKERKARNKKAREKEVERLVDEELRLAKENAAKKELERKQRLARQAEAKKEKQRKERIEKEKEKKENEKNEGEEKSENIVEIGKKFLKRITDIINNNKDLKDSKEYKALEKDEKFLKNDSVTDKKIEIIEQNIKNFKSLISSDDNKSNG